MKECIEGCQTAEDVIRNMFNIYGNALAHYQGEKQEWCLKYMKKMHKILLKKFDLTSAYILEYVEKYTKYTEEEMEKQRNQQQHKKD